MLQKIRDAILSVTEPVTGKSLAELSMLEKLELEEHIVRVHLLLDHHDGETREVLRQNCAAAVMQIGDFDVRVKMRPRNRAAWENPKAPKGLRNVRHVVLVVSGKGGVGKSTVATNLALALYAQGLQVGLLDADIYGPSIPTMMGINRTPEMDAEQRLLPLEQHGIRLMSSGFLIDEDKALIWRGPMIHKIVSQFVSDVHWGELDVLLIDLPPGTGDVQLSLAQTACVRGAVLVTTPQMVALADVRRANTMLKTLNIPVIGVIENMAGLQTSSGEIIHLFSTGGGKRLCSEFNTRLLASIPLDEEVCRAGDAGVPAVVASPASSASAAISQGASALWDCLQQLQSEGILSEMTETKR